MSLHSLRDGMRCSPQNGAYQSTQVGTGVSNLTSTLIPHYKNKTSDFEKKTEKEINGFCNKSVFHYFFSPYLNITNLI